MKTHLSLTLLLFLILSERGALAQYFEKKDIVISTLLIDVSSRLNVGIEYFLHFKNKQERWDEHDRFSVALNAGTLSTVVSGQAITGYNWSVEANYYTGFLSRSRKWNDYVGLKFGHGNLHNASGATDYTLLFTGFSSGIHPIIAKRIALKISTDIGYMQHGLPWMAFNNDGDNLHSGFTLMINMGVGWRF